MLILEIVLLIFFARNLSKIAIIKGESPVKWAIICILAWLAGESLASILLISAFGLTFITDATSTILVSLFGIGMGLLFYIFVKQALLKLPDPEED